MNVRKESLCPLSPLLSSQSSRYSDSVGAVGNSGAAPDRLGFAVSVAARVRSNGLPGWVSSLRSRRQLLAPILQLAGVVSPLSALHATSIQIAGIAVAIVGIGATVYAQVDMGDSWRIGVDTSEVTTLVRSHGHAQVTNDVHRDLVSTSSLRLPRLVADTDHLVHPVHTVLFSASSLPAYSAGCAIRSSPR